MISEKLIREIDKTMNFVIRKIYEGKLLIYILDEEKYIFAEIKNGEYNLDEEQEISEENFKGILLLCEDVSGLKKLKSEFKKIIWKLDNNGFIIIRYENNESIDVDLKKDELEIFLKKEEFLDIESYITLHKNTNGDGSKEGLVILARFHENLLKESPEYEEYTKNSVATKKCGGCNNKSGGCDGCSGCCKK